jgi:hypothetical protein
MINESKMQKFEDIIVEHAGPLGKFIIKKTLSDMKLDQTKFNEEMLSEFVDAVLKRAVFDSSKWKKIRVEIYETCGFPGKP